MSSSLFNDDDDDDVDDVDDDIDDVDVDDGDVDDGVDDTDQAPNIDMQSTTVSSWSLAEDAIIVMTYDHMICNWLCCDQLFLMMYTGNYYG